MTATLKRRPTTSKTIRVELVESYSIGKDDPKLRIDEDAGIIYGVKLGGRFSENCHGIKGVTEGTEYTRAAFKGALKLYEGVKVYPDHDRKGKPRGAFEYLGVIRNARYDDDADCPRGDFHYRKSHPDAGQLVEDVKRGLGGFGFSHHIPEGGYTGRIKGGRLVIEKINSIRSVDLVDDPATTRNLWESKAVATTFKAVLESWVSKKTPSRKAIAKRLIEMDGDMDMAAMDAPVDMAAPEDEGTGDPDQALWDGFKAAVMAILDGDGSAQEKAKKIGEYLKAHEKLTGTAEPAAAETVEEEDEDQDKDKEDDRDEEKKAMESKEIKTLRAKVACLEAGVEPQPAIVKALGLLESEQDRKALLEATKGNAKPAGKVKSSGPGRAPLKEETEKDVPEGKKFVSAIRG